MPWSKGAQETPRLWVGVKSGRVVSGSAKPLQQPCAPCVVCGWAPPFFSSGSEIEWGWRGCISLQSDGIQQMHDLPSPWGDGGTLAREAASWGWSWYHHLFPRVNEWTWRARSVLKHLLQQLPLQVAEETRAWEVTRSGSHRELVSDWGLWLPQFLCFLKTPCPGLSHPAQWSLSGQGVLLSGPLEDCDFI